MKHIQVSLGIWLYSIGVLTIVESLLVYDLPFMFFAFLTTVGLLILSAGFALLHPKNL